jgi:hypothetical protein
MMERLADKDFPAYVDKRFKGYKGDITKFERALGVYLMAKRLGWKVSLLIHDKRTIKECETILGLDLRQECDPEGPMREKAVAWHLMQKIQNFWKAVKGEIPGIRSTQAK